MKITNNLLSITIILLILVGCASSLISRYDPETHQNLAYLKPDIEGIYAMYQTNNINSRILYTINQRFKYILAYEKSKGDPNSYTVKQIKIVQKMFKRHAEERSSQGIWSIKQANIKLNNILTAIDIVIDTELSKNK